jgi:hypothetical protein
LEQSTEMILRDHDHRHVLTERIVAGDEDDD